LYLAERSNLVNGILIALLLVIGRETLSISFTRSNVMVTPLPCRFSEVAAPDTFVKGAFSVGKINEEERFDVIRHACPGAGACGGMYT
jgi:hypothetical protein